MKAVCVLDSIVRKKDDEPFSIIASYFSENNDSLIRCCESPQASLREKANKVNHLFSHFWHLIYFHIYYISSPLYIYIYICMYLPVHVQSPVGDLIIKLVISLFCDFSGQAESHG